MIDAKRIEEMKRLSAELPKGHWSVESLVWDGDYAVYSYLGFRIATIQGDDDDAQFITESRQFVPDIIAAYEAQAEEIDNLRLEIRCSSTVLMDAIKEQSEQIAVLRKALEFYADERNSKPYKREAGAFHSYYSEDGGKTAREALAWRNTTRK